MLTMDQIHSIREMFYEQGMDISEISRKTGLNWKTVRKYVDKEDFSSPPPEPPQEEESKLDPYKPLIDSWLLADKKAPRKQRHTAKRIHERLQEEVEGFSCSYRLVDYYVAKKKKELNLSKERDGHIPLIHYAGEAQADFGTADFEENGKYLAGAKYLVLSFPYSNGGYLQLTYGENLECLLEGLIAIFEYIGGVPTEIWFDNASAIVTKIIKGGGRKVTERFQQFCEHYRFKPVFMNPESGWEKGSVEAKVGYLRRNQLVPVPQFSNLTDKNKELLLRCDEDMKREHYDDEKERFISELFEEDRQALLPLPSVRFDAALYTSARTDKYGRFTLDEGKHRYSVSPDFCETTVQLKITSLSVTVMDTDMHEIIRHRRLYGEERESMEWVPYLEYISRRPRCLRNSGIYAMMPEVMQRYMDCCENSERGRILKVLTELTRQSGFESAVNVTAQAIELNATDPDSLQSLYRRAYSDVPVLPPLGEDSGIPSQKVIPFRSDLEVLDTALQTGGDVNG